MACGIAIRTATLNNEQTAGIPCCAAGESRGEESHNVHAKSRRAGSNFVGRIDKRTAVRKLDKVGFLNAISELARNSFRARFVHKNEGVL